MAHSIDPVGAPRDLAFVARAGDERRDLAILGGSLVVLDRADPNSVLARFSLAADRGLVSADLDGDGDGDLVSVGNRKSHTSLRIGAEEFAAPIEGPVDGDDTRMVVGDLDGDGLDDLILRATGGFENTETFLLLLRSRGDGTFSATNVPTPGMDAIAVGDLDGDGGLDLVAIGYSELLVFRGDGGGFMPPNSVTREVILTAIELADLDGDGRDDLVLGALDGVLTERSLGGGAFEAVDSQSPGVPLRDDAALAVGRFNCDPHIDVAVVSEDAAELQILAGDGALGLAPPVAIPLGVAAWAVAVGELDGDGIDDLVALSDDTAEVVRSGG